MDPDTEICVHDVAGLSPSLHIRHMCPSITEEAHIGPSLTTLTHVEPAIEDVAHGAPSLAVVHKEC
jgi:hypothetical protein